MGENSIFEVAPDEADELSALEETISLSDGFKLIFVLTKNPGVTRSLISYLSQRNPDRNCQVFSLKNKITHLLNYLGPLIEDPAPVAVLVCGLELTIPPIIGETLFLASLNASRDRFPKVLPCPLLFFLDTERIAAVARGAPDFFSIRSGLFQFLDGNFPVSR